MVHTQHKNISKQTIPSAIQTYESALHIISDAERCYLLNMTDEAITILANAIQKEPNQHLLYCKILELYAANYDKNNFLSWAQKFTRTFSTQHPAWSEVKGYWAQNFKKNNKKTETSSKKNHLTTLENTSCSAHNNNSEFDQSQNNSLPEMKLDNVPEKSGNTIRINLLSKHLIESKKLVRVVSINEYKKLRSQKLEDHVSNRIRDLEGISHLKALRPPLDSSIEEITKLSHIQPNMSEAADCWRAFKTDQLRVLNFDQTFMGVDYYTTVDKSTKLTGS